MTVLMQWPDAELSIHLLYIYAETIGNSKVVGGNPLDQMMIGMLNSNIALYPHISITSSFYENICRYSQFFDIRPEYIPKVLENFVGPFGLHYQNSIIQSRLYYLFLKFVKDLKTKIFPYVEFVLNNIQDILSFPIPKKPSQIFDSQLFIFESAGTMISLHQVPSDKKSEYLVAIVSPLITMMQEIMNRELYKQEPYILHLSRLITVIGSLSKGFPDSGSKQLEGWPNVFKSALECIFAIVSILGDSILIREAVFFVYLDSIYISKNGWLHG